MKLLRYNSRRLQVRLRGHWMATRIDAAEKLRCSHKNTAKNLKEMWNSYLSFAQLEF